MLLNGNRCSWSYKSLKEIRTDKKGEETNEVTLLREDFSIKVQNEANHKRVLNGRKTNDDKYTLRNGCVKRKFFDLFDSPQKKNITVKSNYDFNEIDQGKVIKKPRKKTVKKKIEKVLTGPVATSERVRPLRTKKKINYTELVSASQSDSDTDDNVTKLILDKEKGEYMSSVKQLKPQNDYKIVDQSFSQNKLTMHQLLPKKIDNLSVSKKVKTIGNKKQPIYIKNDLSSESDHDIDNQKIKLLSSSRVNQSSFDQYAEETKLQTASENESHSFITESQISESSNACLMKEVRLEFDEGSPTALLNGSDNVSYDSDCSDDGFIFQTRFSDKNANVVDITNSIENDSIKTTPEGNAINNNESISILNFQNKNGVKDHESKLSPTEDFQDSQALQSLSMRKLKDDDIPSENSTLNSQVIDTSWRTNIENASETGEAEKEDNGNKHNYFDLKAYIAEKCGKRIEKSHDMYDKIKWDSSHSEDETENVKFNDCKKSVDFKVTTDKYENAERFKKYGTGQLNEEINSTSIEKLVLKKGENEDKTIRKRKSEEKIQFTKHCKENKALVGKDMCKATTTENNPIKATKPNKDKSLDFFTNSEEVYEMALKRASSFKHSTSNDFYSSKKDIESDSEQSSSFETYSPKSINISLKDSLLKWDEGLKNITKSLTEEITTSSKHKKTEIQSKKVQNEVIFKNIANNKTNLEIKSKIRSNNKMKVWNSDKNQRHGDKSSISSEQTEANENRKRALKRSKVLTKKSVTNTELEKNTTNLYKDIKPKPKTWEDLQNQLSLEIDSGNEIVPFNQNENILVSTETANNDESEENLNDFWEIDEEVQSENDFNIFSKHTGKFMTEKRSRFAGNDIEPTANKSLLPVTSITKLAELSSSNIINKTIAAMNRSTEEYFSKQTDDSICSWSANSNSNEPRAEYSFSVLSTTIETSNKKLSLTQKKYTENRAKVKAMNTLPDKMNDVLKKASKTSKNVIASKCRTAIRKNSTSKTKLSSKSGKTNVLRGTGCKKNEILLDPKMCLHEYLDDEEVFAVGNQVVPAEKTRKTNTGKGKLLETGYKELRRMVENNSKNVKNIDTLSSSRHIDHLGWYNENESSETNSKKNCSPKYQIEKMYSLRKRKCVENSGINDNGKKMNTTYLKVQNSINEDEPYSESKYYAEYTLNDYDWDSRSSQLNNQQETAKKVKNNVTKESNSKDRYMKYLKKLFQQDSPLKIINAEQTLDSANSNASQIKPRTKFLIEDDDLFSVSSDDSQRDETGYHSEAPALFYDVLEEESN